MNTIETTSPASSLPSATGAPPAEASPSAGTFQLSLPAEKPQPQTVSRPRFGNDRLWLSWDEAVAVVTAVAGPISKTRLQHVANKKGTFRAGKKAGAPLPGIAPVNRIELEQWLSGKRK